MRRRCFSETEDITQKLEDFRSLLNYHQVSKYLNYKHSKRHFISTDTITIKNEDIINSLFEIYNAISDTDEKGSFESMRDDKGRSFKVTIEETKNQIQIDFNIYAESKNTRLRKMQHYTFAIFSKKETVELTSVLFYLDDQMDVLVSA